LALAVSRVSSRPARCGGASATSRPQWGAHSNPTPPLRRPSVPLATLALLPTEADRRSRVPLLEFLKDRPSTSITKCVHSRFPEVRACHTRTRSALVVSHDLGGFLRTRLRGFVAPRSRSWGSPGFLPARAARAARSDIPPSVTFPFEALPSCGGWPVSRLPVLFRSRVPHLPCRHGRCFELPWGPSTLAFTKASLPCSRGRHPFG